MARILIVEDESIVATDIKTTLEGLGYKVVSTASSCEEAIKKAEEDRPDLVLMDIVLKGDGDGIEAASQIHKRFDIPVVYLTAYADDKRLEQTKYTEPMGYLIKPFEDRELHAAIQMALYRHKMNRELKESEEKFRGIFEESPIGIALYDSKGRIINANRSCLNIFGVSEANMANSFKLFDNHNIPEDIKQKLLKGKSVKFETRFELDKFKIQKSKQKVKSEIIYLDMQITPLGLKEKDLIGGYLVQIQDISDRKRMEELRRKAFGQISENIERFAILTDGIRNPLAVISGLADLKIEDSSKKLRHQVNRVIKILEQLDKGWLESENIRKFLRSYQ